MSTTGTTLTIDLSRTIGQESAINEGNNGNPIVEIRVTSPIDETGCGFGIARTLAPLGGHEVLFTEESIVPDRANAGVRHQSGLVTFNG